MIQFIFRRILWTIVVLFGVSILVFTILFAVPADVASTIAGPRASPQVKAQITHDLGLDQPLLVQYSRYMGRILQGDLGSSWMYKQKVTTTLLQRLPYTAALAIAGILCELLIGLPVGLI
jgi:peptide/nickel transport system permease protein